MGCEAIIQARISRKEYQELLERRGFPEEEAKYLTSIELTQAEPRTPLTLQVQATWDLGRLSSQEVEDYLNKFPEAKIDIEKHHDFKPTTREWTIASTSIENFPLEPEDQALLVEIFETTDSKEIDRIIEDGKIPYFFDTVSQTFRVV